MLLGTTLLLKVPSDACMLHFHASALTRSLSGLCLWSCTCNQLIQAYTAHSRNCADLQKTAWDKSDHRGMTEIHPCNHRNRQNLGTLVYHIFNADATHTNSVRGWGWNHFKCTIYSAIAWALSKTAKMVLPDPHTSAEVPTESKPSGGLRKLSPFVQGLIRPRTTRHMSMALLQGATHKEVGLTTNKTVLL